MKGRGERELRQRMGLEALELDAQRYRRPWFWLALLAVAALVATAFVVAAARSRTEQNGAEVAVTQNLALARAALSIEDFLGDAVQLANAAADTLGPIRGDRKLAQRLLAGMARSRSNPDIYGMGIFYAPGVFDHRTRLFGPYYVIGPPLRAIANTEPSYEYTAMRWYRAAQAGGGHALVLGPYDENHRSFVSVLQTFSDDRGAFAGVASVDTLTPSLERSLARAIGAGDVAYLTDSTGKVLFASSGRAIPAGPRIDRSVKLRYSHASLHLSSDGSALAAANDGVTAAAIIAGIVIWAVAALIGVVLLRTWRSREATLQLELREARLQHEIGVRKQIETGLRTAAYTDALTGLPNRTPFLERLSEVLAGARLSSARYAVFFIDLDRFNMVNDTLGHPAGDELLKIVAARLRDVLPSEAMVARLGGDEFVVVMLVENDAARLADFLLSSLREPVTLRGRTLYTAASIGVVDIEPHYGHAEELLRDADIAMYQAKRLGRARYAIFDRTMRRRVDEESELETDLHAAIERREFVAYYQPVVDIETGTIASFEALARWQRPGYGLMAASHFIPFAESHGLVDAIDMLMLQNVSRDAAALFARFPAGSVAVNLSAAHLTAPDLISTVVAMLRAYDVAPERMKFEITETAVMTNAVHAQATLERLREIGVRTLLDDFGQGHSSLAYLQHLPIAGLKIDRSFIEPLAYDGQSVAIVRSIVALAKTLGFYTVGEGVETSAQLDVLRALGVDYAQGFFFSPAMAIGSLLDGLSGAYAVK